METQFDAKHDKLGGGLGDSNGLSWTINYQSVVARQEFILNDREKVILRDLAKKVAERAALPIQQEKITRWKKHHALEATRPLIFCDPEDAWYEIIRANELQCEHNLARLWEYKLRKEIYWADCIQDDRVVEPTFSVHYIWERSAWGLDVIKIGGQDGGAFTWESPLKHGYESIEKLSPRTLKIDLQRTQMLEALAHEVFDGILQVKLEGVYWWSLGMTSDLIMLRGFENVLYDFYDNPDELHQLMGFLCEENLALLKYLEENRLLTLNNGGDFHGTGGYAWTDELPQKGFDGRVRLTDLWGFCESQETVGVSPDMFSEFIFPYQLKILELFGLNIYGCCEPLDTRWETVRKIPRLRKVTVSPWSDDGFMAERLGSSYVLCKKVNPSRISTFSINEDDIRKELRNTFSHAKRNDCRVEVLMRDLLTVGNNPQNVIRWVQMAREEADR